MSVPVHCCSESRKWTSETTLNKKSQDCSVILCPVKKTGHQTYLKQLIFLQKYTCALCAYIAQEIFLYDFVSDVFGQHWVCDIPMQYCPSLIDTMLYELFF